MRGNLRSRSCSLYSASLLLIWEIIFPREVTLVVQLSGGMA